MTTPPLPDPALAAAEEIADVIQDVLDAGREKGVGILVDAITYHYAPLLSENAALRGLCCVAEKLIVSATTCDRSQEWVEAANQWVLNRAALSGKEATDGTA